MVTATANPTRMERAVVWMLCRLLPAGFQARQRAEWTGDLIALSTAGAAARSRYLFAAAWTLPSLRAHARRAGFDRPQTTVSASVPIRTLVRILIVGLGVPLVSWLIWVPARWYLLDVPGRFSTGQTFDPKELWPAEGTWAVLQPLWIALHLSSYTVVMGSFLVAWIGISTAVLGPLQRGATGKQRFLTTLLGVATIAFGPALWVILPMSGQSAVDGGLTTAIVGTIAVVTAINARGLTRRSRVAALTLGFAGIAIFVFHLTALGRAMFSWLLD